MTLLLLADGEDAAVFKLSYAQSPEHARLRTSILHGYEKRSSPMRSHRHDEEFNG